MPTRKIWSADQQKLIENAALLRLYINTIQDIKQEVEESEDEFYNRYRAYKKLDELQEIAELDIKMHRKVSIATNFNYRVIKQLEYMLNTPSRSKTQKIIDKYDMKIRKKIGW